MIIAVDFDGTCVTHEFPLVGRNIGAEKVLKELTDNGHQLILFTMRANRPENGETNDPDILDLTGNFLDDAVEWFNKHNIPLYGIQVNPTQHSWTTSPKCYAHLFIDDASLGIPLVKGIHNRPYVDWYKTRELLVNEGLL